MSPSVLFSYFKREVHTIVIFFFIAGIYDLTVTAYNSLFSVCVSVCRISC